MIKWERSKKNSILIIVMAASLILAVACLVYAFVLSNAVDLREAYGKEKTLAVSVIDDRLAGLSAAYADDEGYFLLASYDSENDSVKDIAFSYDNALCALAFMAENDKESAAMILDAFVYAALNDRSGTVRIRNSYCAGNIVGDGYGTVRLPGYYDENADMWIEDAFNVGSSCGNISWVSLAMLWYNNLYENEEDTSIYVQMAMQLMDWVIENCSDDNDGFTAGVNGWTEGGGTGEVLTYKSVEHNIDCMIVFKALFDLTGEERYFTAYESAKRFISSMYNSSKGYYYTGTTNDGLTPNDSKVVLDAQVWTALAANDDFKVKHRKLLKTIKKIKTSDNGYAFCLEEAGGGFWTEGTAFTAMYLYEKGNRKDLLESMDSLVRIQLKDGRFPACSGESISTGMDLSNGSSWTYSNTPHIAPLAWFVMSVDEFNPFSLSVSDDSAYVYKSRIKVRNENDLEIIRKLLKEDKKIVHAGGKYWGQNGEEFTYTNSMEALQNTYKKGNRICEIDFLLSSDGKLVCGHNSDVTWAIGLPFYEAPDHDAFMQSRMFGQLHTMDIDRLVNYMRLHKDLYIVTDIKSSALNNVHGCEMIKNIAPDLMNRFIIQIYHEDEYEKVKDLGFPYIIYTLYSSTEEERKEENILNACEKYDLVAITMPEIWIKDGKFLEKLKEKDVPIFVHTVNDEERMNVLVDYGVDGFYTDDTNAKTNFKTE